MRRLLVNLAQGQQGNSEARAGQALSQIADLAKLNLGYFARNPAVPQALEQYRTRPVNYLVHEMLNADWNLFYSADVADEMAAAKLDYLGSATLAENHLELLLADEAVALITSQPDSRLRQLIQDFMVNQRFRRDVFVRGHARLNPSQIQRNRQNQILMAMRPLANMEPKIKVPRGSASVDPGLLRSLDEIMKFGSAKVADLERTLSKGGRSDDFLRIMAVLTAGQVLLPAAQLFRVATQYTGQQSLRLTGSVNAGLLEMAIDRQERSMGAGVKGRVLVSPVLGATLPIGAVNAIILQSLLGGGGTDHVAARAVANFDRNGLVLRKSDQPITDPAAKLANMTELTKAFIDQELPVLMAAGIVAVV